MNIQPNAASLAGTARAAARGGETDNQASEATRQQAKTDQPAGASGESAVEAGDQTDDRDANGRQLYDTFESSEEEAKTPEPDDDETAADDHEAPVQRDDDIDGLGATLDIEV